MDTKRCFLGIKLIDFSEYQELINSIKRKLDVKVSTLLPTKYHITLHFFGDTTSEQEERIKSEFNNLKFSPFSLEFGEALTFPPNRLNKTRIIAIEPTKGKQELVRLHSLVAHKLEKIGYESEKRQYSPHITIGRVKAGKDIKILAQEWLSTSFRKHVMEITKITLFHSELTKIGANYSTIADFEFS